ncbi:MAG: hypothetical protein ACR2NB_05540 [Solirubrobacteraceae bacterium]
MLGVELPQGAGQSLQVLGVRRGNEVEILRGPRKAVRADRNPPMMMYSTSAAASAAISS